MINSWHQAAYGLLSRRQRELRLKATALGICLESSFCVQHILASSGQADSVGHPCRSTVSCLASCSSLLSRFVTERPRCPRAPRAPRVPKSPQEPEELPVTLSACWYCYNRCLEFQMPTPQSLGPRAFSCFFSSSSPLSLFFSAGKFAG